MKPILSLTLGLLSYFSLHAQKTRLSYGFGAFMDHNIYKEVPSNDMYSLNTEEKSGLSYVYADIGFSGNVFKIDERNALSLGVYPKFAFNQWDVENLYGCISVPVMMEYNFGAGSTHDEFTRFGIVGGLGVNFQKDALFGTSDYEVGMGIIPTLDLRYRFFNASDMLNEVSFSAGFGITPITMTIMNDYVERIIQKDVKTSTFTVMYRIFLGRYED